MINFLGLTLEELKLLERVLDDRLQNCDIADEWSLNMNLYIKISRQLEAIKNEN